MAPMKAAAGNAIRRYAVVILGWKPRKRPAITSPRMPRSRLTAKASRAMRKVTSKTRMGIKCQRGWLARLLLEGIVIDCNAGTSDRAHRRGSFRPASPRLCARIL